MTFKEEVEAFKIDVLLFFLKQRFPPTSIDRFELMKELGRGASMESVYAREYRRLSQGIRIIWVAPRKNWLSVKFNNLPFAAECTAIYHQMKRRSNSLFANAKVLLGFKSGSNSK